MLITDYIEQDLKQLILTKGSIPEPLTLGGISSRYEVSVMPVRGAVERLIADGFLLKDPKGRLSVNSEKSLNGAEPEAAHSGLPPGRFPEIRKEVIWRSLRGESHFLRVTELAERYGVGRTKAQNLLQRLAVEGLLEHHARRGWKIRPFQTSDLESFIEARVVLELSAFDRARKKFEPEQIDCLYRANSPAEKGAAERLDDSLHSYWIDLAENHYIADFIKRVGRFYDTLYHSADIDKSLTAQLAKQHRTILRAIQESDWKNAKSAISEDLWSLQPILKSSAKQMAAADHPHLITGR